MTTHPPVSKEVIANDFRAAAEGKLDKKRIDAIAASIIRPTALAFFANGAFAGGFFYVNIALTVQEIPGAPPDRSFSGNGGGLFSFGLGGTAGTFFTDDLHAAFDNTKTFQISLTGSHCSVVLFDSDSNVLGNFIGPALGTLVGVGGGTGGWNNP